MKSVRFGIVLILLILTMTSVFGNDKKVSMTHWTDWMANGSYGMMVHYLIHPQGKTPEAKTADLNRIIDSFDIDFFMKQFEASGADWMIFTIGQNTDYYNGPNVVLDTMIPGHTPKRDLVLEIARRVHKQNKRFIAYLPSGGQSPLIKSTFGFNPDDQSHFQKRWQAVIAAYSVHLGDNCDGWWFDGWYDDLVKGWSVKEWNAAVEAGNPNSIAAYNDGSFCIGRTAPVSPDEGFIPGETHLLWHGQIVLNVNHYVSHTSELTVGAGGELLLNGWNAPLYMPNSRFIDGVQWHALVPIDSTWMPGVLLADKQCHYSDQDLIDFVKGCQKVGGAVTYNVPIGINGHVPEATAAQLARIGKAVKR